MQLSEHGCMSGQLHVRRNALVSAISYDPTSKTNTANDSLILFRYWA